jgi:curved DNA-binding protein CbpA
MPAARSHYDTLNVSPDAELVVIEAAYRALMKKYHPDQGSAAEGGASAAEINQAYAVLRDSGRRADYDRTEYIRQKDMRIAHYQALEVPRQSRMFGWGGWIVALLLTLMLAVVASKGIGVAPAASELAKAADAPLPDRRSQPAEPDPKVMRAADEATDAQLRMNALANRSAAPALSLHESAPPPADARGEIRSEPRHPRAYRAPRRHAAPRTRQEKDFLARQGYIY